MFRRSSLLTFLALFPLCAAAQGIQADQQAYCAYLVEQAKAQSDFLRTPDALAGFTQPNTGLPQQLIAGAQLSLSNLKKAGITLEVARKNCELYRATIGVQTTLQYALPAIEKDALTHRLVLIGEALKSLDALIDQTTKRVEAQNMTRPMLMALVSSRIKLESDRADTQSRVAALYVPTLSEQPLKEQVEAKQSSDMADQKSLARLTRQNNWDVALTVGAHQQINPVANGFEPYGEVSLNYNLASHAIDKHLERSVVAYSEWKKVQENDVVRGMDILKDQLQQSIAVQMDRLKSLQQETQDIEKSLQPVSDAQTTAALDFRNQLTSTLILLGIETGDATYRLDRLREFLGRDF
ncbi:MAG: hypothetical protein ABR905_11675 [Terracidiphilus sp.]|jgi:hypothetical protein